MKIRNLSRQGKREVEAVEAVVEPELLYPLLRWGDVARYRAAPSAHLLLVQDPQTLRGIDQQTMACRYPLTYEYLKRFERLLASLRGLSPLPGRRAVLCRCTTLARIPSPRRRSFGGGWIGGPTRRWSRRVDDPRLGPRPVVPQETCVLVACDSAVEAYYLCGLLNSALVNFLAIAHSVRGGKGFGSPGMLDVLRLRRFDPDSACHRELAACCLQAHEWPARNRRWPASSTAWTPWPPISGVYRPPTRRSCVGS